MDYYECANITDNSYDIYYLIYHKINRLCQQTIST